MRKNIKKQKYVWNKKSDAELQLWPDSSQERYLTSPYIPVKVYNKKRRREIIIAPKHLTIDVLDRFGISAAAITSHKSGYYQSRMGAGFHLVIFTVKGGAEFASKGKKFSVGKGDGIFIPAGVPYDLKSNSAGWNVFWFHLNPKLFSIPISKDSASIFKYEKFSLLERIVEAYEEEIYSENPAIELLSAYAHTINTLLRSKIKELYDCPSADFKMIEAEIMHNINLKWTLNMATKKFNTTQKKLNALFVENIGETFSKAVLRWRMMIAEGLLQSSGLGIADVARKVGYADAFTFSKSFKAYVGRSPSKYAKR